MKTRLILVEGLPGSGKSTTAGKVKEALDRLNIKNDLFYEGNLDHPADYDGVAFYDETQYRELLSSFEGLGDLITQITSGNEEGYFIEYKKILQEKRQIPRDLLNRIFQNDIYELPPSIHMELILNKWKGFVQKSVEEDKIYIFECAFIQNPITFTMIRNGMIRETIVDYVRRLGKIISPLNPVMIYISQDDIEFSFRKAVKERPREWSEGFMDYYTSQGYGSSMGLQGIEGTIEVLKARKSLELDIIKELGFNHFVIDNSELMPERLVKDIENALGKLF